MATETMEQAPRRSWTKFLLQLAGGMVTGAALAFSGVWLFKQGVIRVDDMLAVAMGLAYVILGLTVWLNPYVKQTALPHERLWLRSVAMLLAASTILAPVFLSPYLDARLLFGIIVVLFGASWWLNHILQREVDELVRRVVADTNAAASTVLLSIMLLYAVAERLELVSFEISIWMAYSVVVWVYFLVTQFAWMKRGIGNSPLAKR